MAFIVFPNVSVLGIRMPSKTCINTTGPAGPVVSIASPTNKKSHATGRVSKQEWMQVALDALVSGGVENVRINKLARTLSISKSGFYWHFRNRDHLLQEMTRFWVNEYSRRIISDLIEKEEAPKSKLLKLVHLIRESEAGVFDLAFTAWAKRDENIHTTLDEVRELRMNFVKKILSPNYCSDAEVEARARLFIVYFSWSEVMFSKSDAALEEEPLDQILEIIVGKT